MKHSFCCFRGFSYILSFKHCPNFTCAHVMSCLLIKILQGIQKSMSAFGHKPVYRYTGKVNKAGV